MNKKKTEALYPIICPKCFDNDTFFTRANKKDELILICKKCKTKVNLHLKATEPILIEPIKKK